MPRSLLEPYRITAGLDLRVAMSTESNTVAFRGYATVYDQWYDVGGGPEVGGWREMIVAGAARRTLNARPDVRLLIDHEGQPIARTRSGNRVAYTAPR